MPADPTKCENTDFIWQAVFSRKLKCGLCEVSFSKNALYDRSIFCNASKKIDKVCLHKQLKLFIFIVKVTTGKI